MMMRIARRVPVQTGDELPEPSPEYDKGEEDSRRAFIAPLAGDPCSCDLGRPGEAGQTQCCGCGDGPQEDRHSGVALEETVDFLLVFCAEGHVYLFLTERSKQKEELVLVVYRVSPAPRYDTGGL